MKDMSKRHKSLVTIKGKDNSRRTKLLVAGVGYMGLQKPYKTDNKTNK